MCEEKIINALVCPQCGGPVHMTDTSCPSCGVGIVINYPQLYHVDDYYPDGRDQILDAALLALVKEEAKKLNVEIVPTIDRDRLDIYVRNPAQKLLWAGVIISHLHEDYVASTNVSMTVTSEEKLEVDGRLYWVNAGRGRKGRYLAEGEQELAKLDIIMCWVDDCVDAAFPKPEPPPLSLWGQWKMWFEANFC